MPTQPPATVAMRVDDIDTPALVIDLPAFERNLARMASIMSRTSTRLRPHSKTHKSPIIGLRQIALGAVGVCCQKVSEAESMVQGGIGDVLVTNEIVGSPKLTRLMALAKQARVAVCADHPDNVDSLDEAAQAFGMRLPVLVEVNVGADRCGVEPGEPAVALARQVAGSRGLRFAGLQAYHGSAQHIHDFEKRRDAVKGTVEKIAITVDMLRRHRLECDTVTGGGTGSCLLDIEFGTLTEIQAGSYVFMDADYGKALASTGTPDQRFEPSLFVYTTIMSRPTEGRAVVDAGLKALSVDSGMPLVHDMPDVEYVRASDEHGKLLLTDAGRSVSLGDKLKLVPGHCDPTVNMYDWYVGIRDGRVEAVWPIAARGAVL